MMKTGAWIRYSTFVIGLLLWSPAQAWAAPRLYFDPATAATVAGVQSSLSLTIDTSGQNASGVDAKLVFPKALLQVVSITPGTFFTTVNNSINNQTGTAEIHGYFPSNSQVKSKSGRGVVATIAIKGLAPGRATISLLCTSGSTSDTNIINESGQDIISCAGVSEAEVTTTSASVPTPSVLLKAGGIVPTVATLSIGSFFLLFGLGLVFFRKVDQ